VSVRAAQGARSPQSGPREHRFWIALALAGMACLGLARTASAASAPSAAARATLGRALALYQDGFVAEALEVFHVAIGEAAAGGDRATEAEARSAACAVHSELGDLRAGLADCRGAVEFARAHGLRSVLANANNNLALLLQSLGEIQEAGGLFEEALSLHRESGDAEGEAQTLSNLGAFEIDRGEYSLALDRFRAAERLATQHAAAPWSAAQRTIARVNQGIVLEKLGTPREALDIYRSLLEAPGDLPLGQRATLRVNTAVLYRNLGDPLRALEELDAAAEDLRNLGDVGGLSNTFLNRGLALSLNLEDPVRAEGAFREALRLAEQSGDRGELVQDLFYLGHLLLRERRAAEATPIFERALAAAQKADHAEGRWSALEGLARSAAQRGETGRAIEFFERARQEIERVRGNIRGGERRAGFFGDRRGVYEGLVAILARASAGASGEEATALAGRALEVVESAKARDLIEALGQARESADFAKPATAGRLRELGSSDPILDYFVADGRLLRFVLRAGGVAVADLGEAPAVAAQVAAVHRALARRQAPEASLLAALGTTLLRGVEPVPGETLRISPDRELGLLPFELLPIAGGSLLERATVSYLPSASAAVWVKPPPPGRYRFAGLASPARAAAGAVGLEPLPWAEREVERAARSLGGAHRILRGVEASADGLRRLGGEGGGALHLAVHAWLDERPGRGAGLALAAAGGDPQAGWLRPRELARQRLPFTLAVLSACRSAAAPEGAKGAALASLTSAFLAAGSSGVVATLWDVRDADAAAFMTLFYERLARGLRPAEALREAKRRMRGDARWNRPEVWAAYVLIGDPAPLVSRQEAALRRLLGPLVAVLGVWLWWRSRRRLSRAEASPSEPR
jgi:tetratricopeptide (TPR) repeat protein